MTKNNSIDVYKGLLIWLVVAGHVIGALMPFAAENVEKVLNVMFESIYSFHMAAFFVVAGYMSVKYGSGDRLPLGQFFMRKFRRLLIPYFVFGAMSAGVYLVTCPEIRGVPLQPFLSLLHGGGWPDGAGFKCNSVLWFLPAMFMTVLCGRLFEIWIRKRIAIYVVLCMALVPITGIIVRSFGTASWPWALVVLPRWLSVYFAGRIIAILSGEKDVMQVVSLGIWGALGIPVIVAMAMSVAWLHDNGWSNRIAFSYIAWISGLVGTAISAGIASSLSNSFWIHMGKCSLGIMLLHKFLIVAAVRLLPLGCVVPGYGIALLLVSLCLRLHA